MGELLALLDNEVRNPIHPESARVEEACQNPTDLFIQESDPVAKFIQPPPPPIQQVTATSSLPRKKGGGNPSHRFPSSPPYIMTSSPVLCPPHRMVLSIWAARVSLLAIGSCLSFSEVGGPTPLSLQPPSLDLGLQSLTADSRSWAPIPSERKTARFSHRQAGE